MRQHSGVENELRTINRNRLGVFAASLQCTEEVPVEDAVVAMGFLMRSDGLKQSSFEHYGRRHTKSDLSDL